MKSQSVRSQSVIITGGIQGIGRSILEKFIAQGAYCYIIDLLAPDDERVTNILEKYKNQVSYFPGSIADNRRVTEIFEHISTDLKTKDSQLDVLVNNAGITRDTLAIRMSPEQFDLVIDVNLRGTFWCTTAALKLMVRQKSGYIISLSSLVAQRANPGQVNYAASKAGIEGMTRTLAREYGARNIKINAIAPGFIETDLTQKLSEEIRETSISYTALKRLGSPEDIANIVAFLTSGAADYITGAVIPVDGGMSL